MDKMGDDNDAYAFLDPWFTSLRGRISVLDPDRADTEHALTFGRDPETDWWLRVDWFLGLSSVRAEDRGSTLRRWREALLLAGVLASIDNVVWVRKLREVSRFIVPPFMDTTTHALGANFIIAFSEAVAPSPNDFTCWLQQEFTDDFSRDYKRLMNLCQDEDERDDLMPRLRFLIGVSKGELLGVLEDMLQTCLQEGDVDHECPRFAIDSLDLIVYGMRSDSTLLSAVTRILELGVPIEHVFLPDGRDGDQQSAAWREAYAQFARALCGYGTTGHSGANKITIPLGLVAYPDFNLLCSALQHSRGVRHVTFGIEQDNEMNEVADPFPPGVWSLIALSLMSKDSTSSVEALTVYGVPITDEDADEVFDMTALVYPLHAYVSEHVPRGQTDTVGSRVPRKVAIPAGTTISSYYGFDDEEYTIDVEHETEAFVVYEEAGVAHVLIIGRGFCQVATSALPSKRLKSSRRRQARDHVSSSLLKSFKFSTDLRDTTSQDQLRSFLEYAAGKTLQRLQLEVPNLSERHIRGVLEMCPNVKLFAVSGVDMSSMAVLQDAHDAGVRLQSLELGKQLVPDQALIDYLHTVLNRSTSDEDEDENLLGLRIGPTGDTVLEKLEAMLANSSLRYLEYTVLKPVQACFTRLKSFHQKPTGDIQEPLDAASQLAFLGGLRHCRVHLTDDLKALVVGFASKPYVRTVICREVDGTEF